MLIWVYNTLRVMLLSHMYIFRATQHPTTTMTSVPCISEGLEVPLAWKINEVTEEVLSTESLLEYF